MSCSPQVPGCLIATEEALEFVETRARITAATFLGVRALEEVSAHAQGYTSQAMIDFMLQRQLCS